VRGPMSSRTAVSNPGEPASSASLARSTWAQGQNAGAMSPFQHRPQCTPTPSAWATAASFVAKRVFPIPGGPATMIVPPDPPLARWSAAVGSRSSRSPTDQTVRDHARTLPCAAVRVDRMELPPSRGHLILGETLEEGGPCGSSREVPARVPS
jgi:hypothetical protein